jgi:hypothetical protein
MRKHILALSVLATSALGASLSGCTASVAGDVEDLKAGAHFVGDPSCTQTGTTLECEGTIAGLGNRAVTVQVDVTRECINRGQHSPPGLVTGESGPIAPENGRIDFDVSVDAGCPSHQMTAEFISPAEVSVYQGNNLVFFGTIEF